MQKITNFVSLSIISSNLLLLQYTLMIPCIFNLGTGEVIIIVVVILLLFGAKRIPELARGLGKGVHSFKQGLNDVTDELQKPADGKPAPGTESEAGKEDNQANR